MPSEHAVLSPSSADRWLSCPASVRLGERVKEPEESSVFAREGTDAHTIAEAYARCHILGETSPEELAELVAKVGAEGGWDQATLVDMETHAKEYTEYLRGLLSDTPHGKLLLEQRVQTGVDGCWGTSDAVIVSPTVVIAVDYKYGMGIPVYAERNPQVRLYALGALDTFGDVLGETEMVAYAIFQPRVNGGHVSYEATTPQEIRGWREHVVAPAAVEALGPAGRFGPSEKACRWCPVRGTCRQRMLAVTSEDFGAPPEELTPEEMARLLHKVSEIERWCSDLRNTALDRAYSGGEHLPGYKVVMSGGRRVVQDTASAIQRLIDFGFNAEEVADFKMKSLSALEKLVKGAAPDQASQASLDDLLEGLIVRTEGKPALVVESDKRPSIRPEDEAARDFSG